MKTLKLQTCALSLLLFAGLAASGSAQVTPESFKGMNLIPSRAPTPMLHRGDIITVGPPLPPADEAAFQRYRQLLKQPVGPGTDRQLAQMRQEHPFLSDGIRFAPSQPVKITRAPIALCPSCVTPAGTWVHQPPLLVNGSLLQRAPIWVQTVAAHDLKWLLPRLLLFALIMVPLSMGLTKVLMARAERRRAARIALFQQRVRERAERIHARPKPGS